MADKQLWNRVEPKAVRYTIEDFEAQFPDDSTCLEWLRQYLYPDGVECKLCGKVTKHHRDSGRPSYSCDECGHHVHPTAGTIFHKSTTPLRLWFYAIYLMSSTRCGISAKHLERELGVTYKTAWRMFKQIRSMLEEDITVGGDGAGVEIDEMYAGGKRKNGTGRPMRGDKTKTPVIYVIADTHTNSVEEFWSLIKRGIGGAHHAVSQKFLQSYLNEFSFRYNRRHDAQPMFMAFLRQISKVQSTPRVVKE